MISADEYAQRFVRKSMLAFLEGKKNLAWIVGVIGTSGMHGQTLQAILDELNDYSDSNRYRELLSACREKGWLS